MKRKVKISSITGVGNLRVDISDARPLDLTFVKVYIYFGIELVVLEQAACIMFVNCV